MNPTAINVYTPNTDDPVARQVVTPTALIAVDLDRTLIYSSRWFRDADRDAACCVETRDGREISFMTPAAVTSLEQLAARQVLVPATTRAVAQYQRIALPGGPYRYAVTSNGGTILIDGHPDEAWAATVAATLRAESAPLGEIMAALHTRVSDAWVRRVVTVDELFCYLVIDESALATDFVASWRQSCRPRGWDVVRHDRTIYTLPQSLCKCRAVDEVQRRLTVAGDLPEGAPLLAAGDSVLDAPLLSAATAAFCPAHAQLHAKESLTDRLTVTTTHGARAAEEILTGIRERIAGATQRVERTNAFRVGHFV